MSVVVEQPTLVQRALQRLRGIDAMLLLGVLMLAALGLIVMASAGYDSGTRLGDHTRNMLIGAGLMLLVAQVPPQKIRQVAVPLYALGVMLLVATALFGVTKKGATRWLNVGVVIQPSEIMKLAMPLMLAWWFQHHDGRPRGWVFGGAVALLLVPVALVAKQPDLGTAILVLAAGLYVLFLAGLSWWLIVPAVALGAIGIGGIVAWGDELCQPGVDWHVLREYQKQRVCTLLDPTRDPLGKGFHILQGMIAIGSGGLSGKGFMAGTQTHLEFIPERTTDFVFAAMAEEFGLAGALALMAVYLLVILRGLWIAAQAPTLFGRLLAGSLSLSFFTYCLVNLGMVSGILPVVGVPLPFISYGGTAMVTLGLALGMTMSVAASRGLMQR